jgi:hypothetical protein
MAFIVAVNAVLSTAVFSCTLNQLVKAIRAGPGSPWPIATVTPDQHLGRFLPAGGRLVLALPPLHERSDRR